MTLDRITTNPQICGGKPCIRGMRFPVHQIVELVAAGNTFDQIIDDYPYIEKEDIRQALEYSHHLIH